MSRSLFPSLALAASLAQLSFACGNSQEEAPPEVKKGEVELCETDDDCKNELYCDGEEQCRPEHKEADSKGCVGGTAVVCSGGQACSGTCDEELRGCAFVAHDADQDGHGSTLCEEAPGDDCDDQDPNRFPGNSEVCDFEGHDEDCDPRTFGGEDFDGDGEIDSRCCNTSSSGESFCGEDCDDLRANIGPGNTEACDGFDNDCDGEIDEGVTVTGYIDADRDLVGDSAAPMAICAGTPGFSTMPGDCDDTNPQVSPLYPESCDGIDNDCDGDVDEDPRPVPWYDEQDGDSYGSIFEAPIVACEAPDPSSSMIGLDCNDDDPAVGPFSPELCDGLDNNCNGFAEYLIAPGDYEDDDGDGFADVSCDGGTDCDDKDPTTYPGALERADGRDNDCNGKVDDNVVDLQPWYKDDDGDGYGQTAALKNAASRPAGFAALKGDCDDSDSLVHPLAREKCNAVDDNCNGHIDEGASTESGGVCLVCDSGTWNHDGDASTACAPLTDCEPGEYTSVTGSPVRDRQCSECAEGTFSTTVNAPTCAMHSPCSLDERLVSEGTGTEDTVCALCDRPYQTGNGSTCEDAIDCSRSDQCPAHALCNDRLPRDVCLCEAGYRGVGIHKDLNCIPDCASEGLTCSNDEACYVSDGVSTCTTTEASCLAILNANKSGGTGLYKIDPDGAGGEEPFEVFCDMDTEGGGWTLIREGREGTYSSVEGLPNGSGDNVHLSPPRMIALAQISSQVMIYDTPQRYTFSDANSRPIFDLRQGKRMYDADRSAVVDYSGHWNGPRAQFMKGGYCSDDAPGDYPNGVFRACNWCPGISWFGPRASWACSGWKDDKMALLYR